MSFAPKLVSKPISMATNGCLISAPSLFTTSNVSYSHLHIPIPYKPIKFHLSTKYISTLSLPSLFSLKKQEPFSRVSAQQGENNPLTLEEKADEGQEFEGSFSWDESGNGESEVEGEESSYAQPPEEAKVYVGNLPYDVDSEKLAHLFEQAGVVQIAEVIYNRDTDQSRGFGFVTMSTEEEAEKAVEMFHRYDLRGRSLTVNKAGPKGSQPERGPRAPRPFEPSHKMYVGNLPWNVDDARLGEVFSEHGKVVSARVHSDRETGRSRGFGFVVMSSESEMNDAIANLDGQSLDGRAIRVNAAEDRQRRTNF